MSLSLQAVDDQATDQNFRQITERWPLPSVKTVSGKEARLNSGEAKLEWAVKAVKSSTLTITHGLGIAPLPGGISLTLLTSEASLAVVDCRILEGSITSTQFKVIAHANLEVEAGTKLGLYWTAIG